LRRPAAATTCCRLEEKAQAFNPCRKESIMFKKFLKDESGLELSEYAVAAALVAVATVAAFQLLGTNIGSRINALAGWIK
jgi:pilus assembly protein Flp/PilA